MAILTTELPNVFHWFALAFQYICKSLWGNGYWSSHELRDVITLHELPVKIGIGLRQFKGFVNMSIGTDMGKEGTCIDPNVATTAKYKPSGIA